MPQMIEMDQRITLREQLAEKAGPIIVINKFNVQPEEADELLKAWTATAAYFKRQPGFISTQLHRGIGGSGVFVSEAVWESVERFGRAFSNPEVQQHVKAFPSSAVNEAHIFQKVAVPGICVA